MTLFEVSNTFSSGNREYLETLNQNSYEHNGSYEVLFISVLVKTYSLTKLCHVYLYLPKLRMLDWNNLIITFFVKNCNLHDVCENEKVINFGNFEKNYGFGFLQRWILAHLIKNKSYFMLRMEFYETESHQCTVYQCWSILNV